ncbi:MAG: hypothetical protein EXS50_01535 [Candidatus Taylorbacteria bacterium]|nr:hypothetical protein [Candidatus Taylorbacteria bacterium]
MIKTEAIQQGLTYARDRNQAILRTIVRIAPKVVGGEKFVTYTTNLRRNNHKEMTVSLATFSQWAFKEVIGTVHLQQPPRKRNCHRIVLSQPSTGTA